MMVTSRPPGLFPVVLLTLLAALFAAASSSAQDPAEPDTSYLAGEIEIPAIGISIDQAQRLATANSPAARAALAGWRSARGARMREVGTFDPALFGEGSQASTDTPISSPFAASETRLRALSGGMSWLSPIGTDLSVRLSQVETETNAPFAFLTTERRSRARVEFVQPLLKGFGVTSTRGELRALDRELEAAARRLGAATLDLGAAVEVAYWELYAAERDLEVQRIQRQRAAVFVRDQLLRSRAGASGPGAVAAARRFLAEQEALMIDVRLRARAASDRLNEVMGIAPGTQERIHCTDTPPEPTPVMPLETALERAYRNNGVLAAATADAEAARARYRRAVRNAWPEIEAFGGYGGTGLAGVARDTLGIGGGTDFSDAWQQVWNDSYPEWNLGVRLRVPLGWRSDRGERERQQGNFDRALEAERALRLSIESQVRQAHREAEQSQLALRAMQTLVEAAREQARIGRLEFQTGRTTAYDLVGIEADLARAEFQISSVMVRVARAQTELRRLTQAPPETTP